MIIEEEFKEYSIEELSEMVIEYHQEYIDANAKIRKLASEICEKRFDNVTMTEMLVVISLISLKLAQHIIKK